MTLKRLTQIATSALIQAASLPAELLTLRMRARAAEHLAEGTLTTVETDRGPIRFFCPSPLLVSRAENLLTKEPDTIHWIDSFPDNCVFWDVGANVGVYSLYAAAKRNARVLSFEPSAANFYVLSRNIELNAFGERVSAYCVALSGVSELGVLNMTSSAMGSALSQFGHPGEMSRYTAPRTSGCAHAMIGFAMDDFVDEFQPSFPSHLKMDVDGLEWAILQGARATLRDLRLRSLMVELTLSDKNERDLAVALLADCGFRLVSVGDIQGTESEQAANHLF
jgi:FkbM family methyltransferase